MKIYDYSRKRSTSKDIQWDQIDEEIRRLWDVLYNKREIYPNQIDTTVNSLRETFKTGRTFAAGLGHLVGMATGASAQPNWGIHSIGCNVNGAGGVGINSTNYSFTGFHAPDEVNAYVELTPGTAANSLATVVFSAGNSNLGLFLPAQWPYVDFEIRTGETIASQIIHIGLIPNTGGAPAAGNEHLPTADTTWSDAFTVFFKPSSTAASDNWQVCTRYGTQAASLTDTGVKVVADTYYRIEIDFTRIVAIDLNLDYQYEVLINGSSVFSVRTNSPASDNYPYHLTGGQSYVRRGMNPIVWIRSMGFSGTGIRPSIYFSRFYADWGYDPQYNLWTSVYGTTSQTVY
mgnify:CR=1 FL=1